MAWCIANDLDFEGAKVFLPERFPFLEHTPLFDYRNNLEMQQQVLPPYVLDSVKHISNLPGRRFIKAHLPFRLLPQKIQDGSTKAKFVSDHSGVMCSSSGKPRKPTLTFFSSNTKT
uniref:Sulfotransferase domain-containing protein n=1 Tax=Cacopsylla melanoneura TaxID=428564 RepID=A0A8D8UP80_9HEMI